MIHVDNFAYGPVTPVLAYTVSCIGCFLGLRCTTRASVQTGRERAKWLAMATIAIGGTGIWTMHFIAMLGWTIPGQAVQYNVPVTVLSLLISFAVVGVGLAIVGTGRRGMAHASTIAVTPLLAGGAVVGVGVAAMHYTGMAALQAPGFRLGYNLPLVGLSVLIAVAAGTAALWAAMRIHKPWAAAGAALIMGFAVCGMHYTGMAALRVRGAWNGLGSTVGGGMCGLPGIWVPGPHGGVSSTWFIFPLIVGTASVVLLVGVRALLSLSAKELAEDAALDAKIAKYQHSVLLSQIAGDEAQHAAMTAGIRDYQKHAPSPASTQTAAPWLTETRVDYARAASDGSEEKR